jgi:hypothetical protein
VNARRREEEDEEEEEETAPHRDSRRSLAPGPRALSDCSSSSAAPRKLSAVFLRALLASSRAGFEIVEDARPLTCARAAMAAVLDECVNKVESLILEVAKDMNAADIPKMRVDPDDPWADIWAPPPHVYKVRRDAIDRASFRSLARAAVSSESSPTTHPSRPRSPTTSPPHVSSTTTHRRNVAPTRGTS